MGKQNRLYDGNKPTVSSIEALVAGISWVRRDVIAEDCVVAPYSIQAKQTTSYQFLAFTGASDRPLMLGRIRSSGKIEIILGAYHFMMRGAGERISVLVADMADIDAVRIAIIIGKEAYPSDTLALARAYAGAVSRFNINATELARCVGVSLSHVTRRLNILEMPEYVKGKIAAGAISYRDARSLLRLRPREMEDAALNLAVKGRHIDDVLGRKKNKRPGQNSARMDNAPILAEIKNEPKSNYIGQLEAAMAERLGTPVSVIEKADGGVIELRFHSAEAASGVLESLIAARCPSTIGGIIRFEMPSKAAMDGFVMAVIPSEDEY